MTNCFSIRPYQPADLPSVLAIERASFSVPWSENSLRQAGEDGSLQVLVNAVGILCGFGCVTVVPAAAEAEICNLAVAPGERGHGLGEALLCAMLAIAAEQGAMNVYLEVRESNTPARRLYEKQGFALIGRRKRYYTHPTEDALIMLWENRKEDTHADFSH